MTIRLRLALWYGFAIAATIAIAGSIVWVRFAADLRSSLEQALAVQVADTMASLDVVTGRDSLLEDPARPGIFTLVLDRTGAVVARSRSAPLTIGPVPLGASTWRPAGVAVDDALFAGRTRDGRTVVAGSSLARIQQDLESLAGLFLLVGGLAALASLVGGWWLARRALAPVDIMVAAAERIHGMGAPLGSRLRVPGTRDELGRLGATLNGMLDRVEGSISRQRAFVASASHDLRTPIAALRVELELARRQGTTSGELRAAIDGALEDVRRLGRLADDLLGMAAAEESGRAVMAEPVDVGELVTGVTERTVAAHPERRGDIELDIGDAALLTDRARVEQALANLIANAVGHSPPGSAVTVRAYRVYEGGAGRDQHPVLEVDVLDRGPGVPPGMLGKLFVPFARSRDGSGGTGLGLATADSAVRALGGRIGYRDRPGGGAWFWFRVPAPEPA